jgi:hypothetical protein
VRPLNEMQTIQIELTSACVLKCSNCTRFCGTHQVPFFIEETLFKQAIDSLVEYSEQPHAMVGFMGGEPLLHPQFAQFCEYARTKIAKDKLGLWSTFPDAPKYRGYREVICETFGNVLLNDHSRPDILHAPVLMAAEDIFTNDRDLFAATERCWIQESWSASINPKGAWFCEVAGALSDLFDGPEGWKVEPGWWKRTTKDFTAQREWACRKCGAALPIARQRNSQDERDDVSKSNLERLKAVKSRKVAKGDYVLHEQFPIDPKLTERHGYPSQTYKDVIYRQQIAARYGIFLVNNARGYLQPFLAGPDWKPRTETLYQITAKQFPAQIDAA